ncbi:hypothetical protein SO802_003161 [Lithocarpus litseifolius]|uniref:Uncharacterized protein n=1 Tax=Lithocarpus litseifolius TaxID=425828 RepID=A0AAW2DZX7_9ROSI
MSRVRDRTEDLKDAVRKTALSLEDSEDYVDLYHTTDQERDSIEHEVSTFIEACQEQIDIIKNSINNEEANSRGWLGVRAVLDNTDADTIEHKHGVVLILSERLHSVTMQFDQLRAIRFQDAINRAMPRRKLHHNANSNSTDTSKSNMSEFKEPDEFQPDHLRAEVVLKLKLLVVAHFAANSLVKLLEMGGSLHLAFVSDVEATKNVELGKGSVFTVQDSQLAFTVKEIRLKNLINAKATAPMVFISHGISQGESDGSWHLDPQENWSTVVPCVSAIEKALLIPIQHRLGFEAYRATVEFEHYAKPLEMVHLKGTQVLLEVEVSLEMKRENGFVAMPARLELPPALLWNCGVLGMG